jgi:hypothetical protein
MGMGFSARSTSLTTKEYGGGAPRLRVKECVMNELLLSLLPELGWIDEAGVCNMMGEIGSDGTGDGGGDVVGGVAIVVGESRLACGELGGISLGCGWVLVSGVGIELSWRLGSEKVCQLGRDSAGDSKGVTGKGFSIRKASGGTTLGRLSFDAVMVGLRDDVSSTAGPETNVVLLDDGISRDRGEGGALGAVEGLVPAEGPG